MDIQAELKRVGKPYRPKFSAENVSGLGRQETMEVLLEAEQIAQTLEECSAEIATLSEKLKLEQAQAELLRSKLSKTASRKIWAITIVSAVIGTFIVPILLTVVFGIVAYFIAFLKIGDVLEITVSKTNVIGTEYLEQKTPPKPAGFGGVFVPKLVSKSTSHISYVIGKGKSGPMKNYVFGYARVSTEAQNLDRQLDALQKYGVDMIFNEKMTGTKRDRPELSKLLDRMTEGDTVVVESLSRLGRSAKDLIELTELFQNRGVHLVSLKEAVDTSTSTGKLLFTLMSAIAQFERDVIADRTREGLRSARARGRTGGRPKADPDAVKKAVKLYNTKQCSIREIEELTGVKKSTLYRSLQGNIQNNVG